MTTDDAEPGQRSARLPLMSDDVAYDEPSKVEAKDGDVVVDGPDGVDVKLTPTAAVETSDRLLEAGVEAQGQRLRQKDTKSP